MTSAIMPGQFRDNAATDSTATRLPRDRATWLRWTGRLLALLSIPGAVWPVWELLRATPWVEQDWTGRLGQATWLVGLLLIPLGAALAFRSVRTAGRLLLTVGATMGLWALIGRFADAEHWAPVFLVACAALILPTLAAATLLTLAANATPDDDIQL